MNAGLKQIHREQKTMDHPYHILLADDHVGFRREVRKILEEIPDVKVTGEAGNRRELFELLRQSPPKLVILDMSMPDLRAGEGTQLIKLHYPETKVLIMVMDQEQRIPEPRTGGRCGRGLAETICGGTNLPGHCRSSPGEDLFAAPGLGEKFSRHGRRRPSAWAGAVR